MANGNLTDIGYRDILGSTQYGGDPLSSLIKALIGTVGQSARFGEERSNLGSEDLQTSLAGEDADLYNLITGVTGGRTHDSLEGATNLISDNPYSSNPFYEGYWSAPEEELDMSNLGTGQMGKGQLVPVYASGEEWNLGVNKNYPGDARPEYTLDNLLSKLKSIEDDDKWGGGIKQLIGALEGSKIGDLTTGYRQDITDINTEMQSELKKLQTGIGVGGKGARYGGIGSKGKSLSKGGRGKYLSDYYGLKDEQYEMQSDLRKQLEEDFMGNLGSWLQYSS